MNSSKAKIITWLSNANNWLPIIQWSGWVIVVILLAKIFWIWFLYFSVPTEFKPIAVPMNTPSKNSQKIDITPLLNLNLFGSVEKAVEPVETKQEKVEKTRLNLTLRGIYAAETKEKANAIIEANRGEQNVYFIGDKLKVSGRVYLREVYVDRVILETNGKREQLSLEQAEMPIVTSSKNLTNDTDRTRKTASRRPSRKKVDDKRKDARLTRQLNNYRQKFLNNPKSVADVISARPHVINGELQGFKIQAGKDRRLFQELGLRRGDLVTAVNGTPLNNMQEAMTLMSDVRSLSELNVDIQRGEQQLNLLLNLNENLGNQ